MMLTNVLSFQYYLNAWTFQQKFCPTYRMIKLGKGIDAEYILTSIPINN